MSFIQLKGSEKQVSWANSIREGCAAGIPIIKAEIREYLEHEYSDWGQGRIQLMLDFYNEGIDQILSNDDASFWIDNRSLADWERAPAGTSLARQHAMAFRRRHIEANRQKYGELVTALKLEVGLEKAQADAIGTIKSWEEHDRIAAESKVIFGEGSRFHELHQLWLFQKLPTAQIDEYNRLIIDQAFRHAALSDFINRSGIYESLAIGTGPQDE